MVVLVSKLGLLLLVLIPLILASINCALERSTPLPDIGSSPDELDSISNKELSEIIGVGQVTVGGEIGDLAPEFSGITNWINSRPLRLDELRGHVVLVDIWTYTCVNCIRTIPYLKEWHSRYQDHGLVIIGIHSPEFEFEKIPYNVRRATMDLGISWPVAQDNNMKTWNSYNNRYWPAKYIIDKNGVVRYRHFGEGSYAETENVIRTLLQDYGVKNMDAEYQLPVDQKWDSSFANSLLPKVTPELYFGRARNSGILLSGGTPYVTQKDYYLDNKQPVVLSIPDVLDSDKIYLNGEWQIGDENVTHTREVKGPSDFVAIKYSAKTVNIVMSSNSPSRQKVLVSVNGEWLNEQNKGNDVIIDSTGESYIWIDEPDMYQVVSHHEYKKEMTINLVSESVGSQFYAATFGVYEEGP